MAFQHGVSKQCLYFYSVRVRTYNSFLKCDAQLSFYLVFLSFIVQYSTRVIIALHNIRFYIIQKFSWSYDDPDMYMYFFLELLISGFVETAVVLRYI